MALVAISATFIGFLVVDPFGMRSAPTTTIPAVFAPTGVEADNPIVGAWTFDQDASSPGRDFTYIIFTSDGTVIDAEPTLDTYLGVWTATGPNTIEIVTFNQNITERDGLPQSRGRLTATFELDASGTSFTGSYEYKIVRPDGTPVVTLHGSSTGQKITMDWADATPTP